MIKRHEGAYISLLLKPQEKPKQHTLASTARDIGASSSASISLELMSLSTRSCSRARHYHGNGQCPKLEQAWPHQVYERRILKHTTLFFTPDLELPPPPPKTSVSSSKKPRAKGGKLVGTL